MIPRVYQAISSVAGALATDGVVKARLNSRDNYLYRSIDDVMARLAPLLAAHRLCVLPRVLGRDARDRVDENDKLLVAVTVRAAFDLVSAEDGSRHTVEAYGEALDAGDKGTAKAMQSAYKYAMLQAFCVPAAQGEDTDASSHRLKPSPELAEPPGGWAHWCEGLQRDVQACGDDAALEHLQEAERPRLTAARRERPDLYDLAGRAIAAQREALRADKKARSSSLQEPQPRRAVSARKLRKPASEANGSGGHA
jgi:hypothetical protein